MSSCTRDPDSEEKGRSDKKERKHKHRDKDREGKSKHRSAEAPLEEQGSSHAHKDRDRVGLFNLHQPLNPRLHFPTPEIAVTRHLTKRTYATGPRAVA